MTIIVRRPFEPFEDNKDITNEQVHPEHPEFEEKPVMLPITQTSEDVHGGSEVTFSLPNSPNNSTLNPNSPNEQENQNTANDNQGAQENQNQEQENINDGNGSGSNNQDSEDGDTGNEPNQGQENDIGDTSMQNQGNENNENDDIEESNESEDTDEQSQSGVYNARQMIDVTNGNIINSKYYQTEFYRFIELIAEERMRVYDPMGSEEYNIKKLMFRQFEKKPLSSYKMSRVRESVVIILDNSGSMQWWADNLQILAGLAMQRNDVEVYLAPNGHIEEMLHPKHQLVNYDEIMKRLRNRKIIYMGDFDGANTPIEFSWYNDVIWICPEERYLNFLEHDWVSYDESKFKGAFLRVFTLEEMLNAFRRLLSSPSLKLWYDLCNEHRCGYDEGDEGD